MENKPSPQDENRHKVKGWEVLVRNDDGELEERTLHSYAYQPDLSEIPLIQARPIKITPSKAKRPERPFTRYVSFGDTQIDYRLYEGELHPIHDERAMRCARYILRYLMPDEIINLGDTVDLPQFSHFPKDSNHFDTTLQAAFDRTHQMYAELRADHPNIPIHEVDSNHNVRLGKMVLKNLSQLYGFRPSGTDASDYPMLTYPYMANLKALNITWHGGYGAAAYRPVDANGEPINLMFAHGKEVRSNGSTAELLSKRYPYTNVNVGHGHKHQVHTRTTPDGRYLTYVQNGALCRITGEVSGYNSAVDDMGHPVLIQEDWQQTVTAWDYYGDGYFDVRSFLINNGVAYVDGKVFDGNE